MKNRKEQNNPAGGFNRRDKKEPDKINNRLQGGKFDKVLRENMRFAMPGIMEKVLKMNIVSSEELKDKIQITRQKEVDVLKIVTDAEGDSYILHLEFESSNKPKMHFRMAEYRAMLHQIYDHPVKQYVMYMGKAALNTPSRIDLPGFKFEYTLIPFSELPYQLFLSSDKPEEQILSVLANFGGEDPTEVIRTVLEKLGKNSSGMLTDNKFYEQLRVLVQLRNLEQQTDNAMESVNTFFKKERDTLYKWGKKEGIEKGRHEEALEIARNLKNKGVEIEIISESTGLAIQEIEDL